MIPRFAIQISPAFTLCLALATPALAQSDLDRLEAVSEAISTTMFTLMAAEAGIDAPLPDTNWNSDFRAAGRCMLDAYTQEVGPDHVTAMLGHLETLAGGNYDSSAAFEAAAARIPEGDLSSARQAQVNQTCGMLELQMQRIAESGFMEALEAGQ